jgi:hypothetical protein
MPETLMDLMFAVELVRQAMATGNHPQAVLALREVVRVAQEMSLQLTVTPPETGPNRS